MFSQTSKEIVRKAEVLHINVLPKPSHNGILAIATVRDNARTLKGVQLVRGDRGKKIVRLLRRGVDQLQYETKETYNRIYRAIMQAYFEVVL